MKRSMFNRVQDQKFIARRLAEGFGIEQIDEHGRILFPEEVGRKKSRISYEFLNEHGSRKRFKHDPAKPPDIPAGYRLFDVYGAGRTGYAPMCIDVTETANWENSCTNGTKKWGPRKTCILISLAELGRLTEIK